MTTNNKISGHARLKNGEWWFCQYGSLRGPVEKGFSRNIKYRGIITNSSECQYNGQNVEVVKDGKSFVIACLINQK